MKALVTGTSRGIGQSICDTFIQKDIHVIGTSRSNSGEQLSNYTHIISDLSKQEDLKQLKKIFEGKDVPDVLVNNAAIFYDADFSISDTEWLENWDSIMQVNLRSAALLCKWAVNAWVERGINGRIINITSRAGQRGDTQEYASYAASKGGMIALTKSIARSFGKQGITAYAIAPGFVETDMARESMEVYGEEYLTQGLFLDSIAPPTDIANLTLLLAQGKLIHATGQVFHINSGSFLP